MHIEELNHVAIYVKDLETSIRFYKDKMLLEVIPRPAFDFPGEWFKLGYNQQLHLIATRQEDLKIVKQNHFALKVKSAKETEMFLVRQGVSFTGPKPRPDGAIQLFIQDPDGYYIELFELK
jgi:lactoylglutathione lyase